MPEHRTDDLKQLPAPNPPLGSEALRVGIIGCGDVSPEYFRGCSEYEVLNVVACADAEYERAASRAAEFGVGRVLTTGALIDDPEIDLVINLTPPKVHAQVSKAAIIGGKHVYSEKPLASSKQTGAALVAAAETAGVRLGCAPDTALGGALQTCRKIIDDGWIGQPLAATAFVTSHGYEHFHPRVDSYYASGAGPMLDVGPYYVTALVHLLGPVARVAGSAKRSSSERLVPEHGGRIRSVPVDVSTHVSGTLDLAGGQLATIVASWDVWSSQLPYMEVYGTEGSLSVPNPDYWDGVPRILRPGYRELEDNPPRDSDAWRPIPLSHRADVGRGIGVADMASAIRSGSPHRTSGFLANHVLEVLLAFDESSAQGVHIEMETTCERPAPLPCSIVGKPVSFGVDGRTLPDGLSHDLASSS